MFSFETGRLIGGSVRVVRLQRSCSWRYPAFGDESHGFWSVMTVHRSCIRGDLGRLAVACGAHAECGIFIVDL